MRMCKVVKRACNLSFGTSGSLKDTEEGKDNFVSGLNIQTIVFIHAIVCQRSVRCI